MPHLQYKKGNGAAENKVCATLMPHYQWKCTDTISLLVRDSLSVREDTKTPRLMGVFRMLRMLNRV